MLPLLEDSIPAERHAQEPLSLESLLLYSAVCGTGRDTIPLPGDLTRQEMASIVVDVAALAMRLDKPLTARLMPIPGKKAGDPTGFSFPFFANSRVLSPRRGDAGRILAKADWIGHLTPRPSPR